MPGAGGAVAARHYREVKEKGPGGHILTGPVYVEDAQPGDVLEVRIQKINWRFRTRTTRSARTRISFPTIFRTRR